MHVYIKSFIHHVSPFVNGLGYMCPMEIVFLKEKHGNINKKKNENVQRVFESMWYKCDWN